jgi:hypothetical protein
MIWNANRRTMPAQPTGLSVVRAGTCVWIPVEWLYLWSERDSYSRSSASSCPSIVFNQRWSIGSRPRSRSGWSWWR